MKLTRMLSCTLLIALVFSLSVSAHAAQPAPEEGLSPLGSAYINYYVAYCHDDGNGDLIVEFDISGTGPIMDEIGAVTVDIMEKESASSSYSVVHTFVASATDGMLGEDARSWRGGVEYDGTIGYNYKAIVTFWVEKDNAGDSRVYTTDPVTLE